MAFTQKSSSVSQRDEGEFPQLPELTKAQMKGWWSNTVAVLDRVRDKIGEIETTTTQGTQGEKGDKGEKGESGSAGTAGELKATLSIEGDAVGTLNTQDISNKGLDGGTFI
jgi:hypothetical protein